MTALTFDVSADSTTQTNHFFGNSTITIDSSGNYSSYNRHFTVICEEYVNCKIKGFWKVYITSNAIRLKLVFPYEGIENSGILLFDFSDEDSANLSIVIMDWIVKYVDLLILEQYPINLEGKTMKEYREEHIEIL